MDNKKIVNVAILGTGNRASYVVKNLLNDSEKNVKILAVYEPDKKRAAEMIAHWESPDAKICDSTEEAVNFPGVEWILVFSPNACHKEGILAGFKAGKHVFTEKPLATSIEDCLEIYNAHQASKSLFMTGFVLRYAPIYRKAKEILENGVIGKLLSIDANENIAPAHGGYIMMNWRRHTSLAGPHLLEKCCHDLDLLNWLINSLPSKVAGFGSLDYFVPENSHYADEMPAGTFDSWNDHHRTKENAFDSDKDLKDTQVAIMRYRNGVKVQFQATMSNIIPERRMYFSCTEGTMILELYTSTVKYRRMGENQTTSINFGADGHGGGDNYIMKELYHVMCTGEEPKSSGSEGLESAVTALAIDKAMNEETVVNVEPIWKGLGR